MKFSPALSVSRAGPATRPDLIAVEELQQWSSANSFAQAAAGFYGNADLASWPAPLTTVRFNERVRPVTLRVLQHPEPHANFGAGQLGQITSSKDPRIGEMATKISF